MKTFDPKAHHFSETHRLLLGGIAPRPIAFVATLSKEGKPNLCLSGLAVMTGDADVVEEAVKLADY